jgi:hypothetical protein
MSFHDLLRFFVGLAPQSVNDFLMILQIGFRFVIFHHLRVSKSEYPFPQLRYRFQQLFASADPWKKEMEFNIESQILAVIPLLDVPKGSIPSMSKSALLLTLTSCHGEGLFSQTGRVLISSRQNVSLPLFKRFLIGFLDFSSSSYRFLSP